MTPEELEAATRPAPPTPDQVRGEIAGSALDPAAVGRPEVRPKIEAVLAEDVVASMGKVITPGGPHDLSKADEERILREMAEEDLARQREISLLRRCKKFHYSDLGNAERFIIRYGNGVRYCPVYDSWFIWNGKLWGMDRTEKVRELAKNTAERIHHEAEIADERRDALKWAFASEGSGRITAMLQLARSAVPVVPEDLDANQDLLTFPNGTLELATMTLREHRMEDLITRSMGFDFTPGTKAPKWEEHLKLVYGDNRELIWYLQKLFGHALRGRPEQLFPIMHGGGDNGKTMTCQVLMRAFGDYAVPVAAETLMLRREPADHRTDIVDLMGARLIIASESEEGYSLSGQFIKRWFSGGEMKYRRAYADSETKFRPAGLLMLDTNNLPIIRDHTHGMWRRLRTIPHDKTIPPGKKGKFTEILEDICSEGEGIIQWLIEGLRGYLKEGLEPPACVFQRTEAYREESDPLAEWKDADCELQGMERRSLLYADYLDYVHRQDDRPMGKKSFYRIMDAQLEPFRDERGRYYKGIRLKSQETWK